MNEEVLNHLKICFPNHQDYQTIKIFLEGQGVSELEELEFIDRDQLLAQGLNHGQVDDFLSIIVQNTITDEFMNKLSSMFPNQDQLSKIIQMLEQAKILDQKDFLKASEKESGLKSVEYKKIRQSLMGQRPSSAIERQPSQFQIQQRFQKQLPDTQLLENDLNGLKIFSYPKQNFNKNDHPKVILIVGETGCGKTTFLNFMSNYLSDVQLYDPFRYRLIQEDPKKTQDQSQTTSVISYQIRGCNSKPDVIVVDTPGFGDTRGFQQDRDIEKQLGQFFKTLQDVHLIAFVLKSSECRLTQKQQYIFNSVLQLFGKDIAENIVALLTFSDSQQQPQALAALKAAESPFSPLISQIKDPWYFRFNNSALDSDPKDDFTAMYWKIAISSFDQLFQKKVSSIPKKQLVQTGMVISERETLQYMVTGLQAQLNQCLAHQQGLKDLQRQIEMNKDNIQNNKDFTIIEKTPTIDVVPLKPGEIITNCTICKFTCHFPCGIPNTCDKKGCAAITKEYCAVCPKKCYWSHHQSDQVKYVPNVATTKTSFNEVMRQKFNSATQQQNAYKTLMDDAIKKLKLTYEQGTQLQVNIVQCMTRLDQIALVKPQCASQIQYLEMLELNEQSTKADGWQERLKSLREMKDDWKLIEDAYKKSGKYKSLMDFANDWLNTNKVYNLFK